MMHKVNGIMDHRMMRLDLQQFAEGAGDDATGAQGVSAATGSVGAADTGVDTGNAGGGSQSSSEGNGDGAGLEALNAEIARLKAEAQNYKLAIDKATKEAAAYKREIKAKMTAEEIAAKEKEEADQKAAQELEDLRREVAKGKTVKSVMGKLGLDEETSGNLADHLFGAADIENALLEIQKAWVARERALKLEYGKIPGPGTGGVSPEEAARQAAIDRAKDIGKARAEVQASAKKALENYLR